MSRPTHYVFTNGMSQDEHDRVCDKQTTLVAKRIVQNQRATPKMTVQQATEWLQKHDPAYLAGDYHDSNIDG